MAKKRKAVGDDNDPKRKYKRTYLHEWLAYRNKTQDQLAEFVGTTRVQVNRIINGRRKYDQEFLELAADYLETSPASLLMRDPSEEEVMWSLWERATAGQRADIERLARVVVATDRKAG